MAITKAEYLWREWFLAEGRFAGGKPHDPKTRHLTGAPAPGTPEWKKVAPQWWARLERFLAKRYDRDEPGRPPGRDDTEAAATQPPAPAAGRLSDHFRVREFDCKDGTRVPAVAVPALRRLVREILEPMRAQFGPALVMSGYRHRAYNRRIGGASQSQHIYELTPASVATDLVFREGRPAQWARLADRLGAGGVGSYPTFVHVDNRPGRARWSG